MVGLTVGGAIDLHQSNSISAVVLEKRQDRA